MLESRGETGYDPFAMNADNEAEMKELLQDKDAMEKHAAKVSLTIWTRHYNEVKLISI
jgi:hypothetical protein